MRCEMGKPLESLPEIIEITMTCSACPSQWEGKFADGDELYIRYRYAGLRVDKDSREVLYTEYGEHPLDGLISLDKVLEITGLKLAEGVVEQDDL